MSSSVPLPPVYSSEEDLVDDLFARMLAVEPPAYSNFRVMCTMVCSVESKDQTSNTVFPIYGMNMESCHISGSICAERSALAQLNMQFRDKITTKRPTVLSLYISSDNDSPLTPGLSCRELLLEFIGLDVPIHCISRSPVKGQDKYVGSLRTLFPYPPHYLSIKTAQIPAYVQVIQKGVVALEVSAVYERVVAAAVLDAKNKHSTALYNVHYAAVAVLTHSDSHLPIKILTSKQSQVAEFMFSLDPITLLLKSVLDEANKAHENASKLAITMLMADQYGLLHSPSACARAHYTEHVVTHAAVESLQVLVHSASDNYKVVAVDMTKFVPEEISISACCS